MLSVVIPALDAEARLDACLRSVQGADEIILVDGGSADATAAIAGESGARVIAASRGRGRQLHAGALAAAGDWLLFLHADTRLTDGWLAVVREHMAHEQGAACFRFLLDDDAWQARLLELGVSLRAGLFGLPYGDQGLLISRSHYDRLGGYRPLALMEDVDLVRRIGRRQLRVLDAVAVTSAERWRRDGWLRRSTRNLGCLLLWAAGVSPSRIARLYG